MNLGVFDIVGPVMIGPSSSHTAGAVRIGKVARKIAKNDIKSVVFYLHGSFAKTYKGHGTDKALLAGILGMDEKDERLREAFKYANEYGVDYEYVESDLGDVHSNTVKVEITTSCDKKVVVIACSIGGGNIKVININGIKVDFTGDYPTIIINHIDNKGVIAKLTNLLYEENVNIAFMSVYRENKGDKAYMVIELDEYIDERIIDLVKSEIKYIKEVTII
jgi:L-serine dehydratase